MSRVWSFYMRMLRERTLVTQMCTSGTIMPLGDSIAQHGLEGRRLNEHDWKRTARFSFYGSILWAPITYRWHKFLNSIQLSSTFKTVATRFVVDMSVFAIFANLFFFTGMGLLEGRSLADVQQRIRDNIVYVYQRNLAVFGPVQVLNLWIVPVYARPPLINCVSLGWSTFLASVNMRSQQQPSKQELIRKEAAAEIIP